MMTAVDVRTLRPGDLDAIEEIERRAYPTPWSRSMFAGELSKPSGICLGAFQGEDMLGYLIVARYVDAWHVMNVAVDEPFRGRGVASQMLEQLFELHRRRRRARLHAGGAGHQRHRDRALPAAGIRRDRHPPRLLHRQPRGRTDHVARSGRGDPTRAAAVILGLETSCDETAAALVDDAGVVHAGVVASQAELHARYGGVVPEVASRRHLELCVPVVEQALAEAGCGWDGVDAIAVTEGPGLIGALLVGLATAKALAFARQLPLIPVDHLHGHVASLYLAPDPVEPPFLLLLASGGHTLLAEVDGRGPGSA